MKSGVVRRCSRKKVLLKILKDLQETTTLLESIFKFILKFIFKSILQLSSCEFCEIFKRIFFHRTPPDDCFCCRFFDILFVGMWNIRKMSLPVTVHPFLLEFFTIDLLICYGMFLIMREMIFSLMIFNTPSHYCYLSSWLFHF